MKPLRSCPICPRCGSKKFERISKKSVKIRCISCYKILEL